MNRIFKFMPKAFSSPSVLNAIFNFQLIKCYEHLIQTFQWAFESDFEKQLTIGITRGPIAMASTNILINCKY